MHFNTNRLKETMTESDISAQQLHLDLHDLGCDVTTATIYNWQKGRAPNGRYIKYIATALNLPIDDLYGG